MIIKSNRKESCSIEVKLQNIDGSSYLLDRAPYPYRKLKVTHEEIFSWLSWLAVLLVGAVILQIIG